MSFLNMSIHDRGGGMGNRYKEWTRKCGEQILGVDQSIRLLLFLLYASTIERFGGRSLAPTRIYFHTERKSAYHFLYMKNMSFIFKLYPPPLKMSRWYCFFFIFQVNLCVSIKLVKHSTIYHTRGEYAITMASLMQFIFNWRCIESYPSL